MTELDDFSRTVADILRKRAVDQGQSQSSLAHLSGVSQSQISRVFAHKRSVSIEDLALIAEALNTSASAVVREAESLLEPVELWDRMAADDHGYSPEDELGEGFVSGS